MKPRTMTFQPAVLSLFVALAASPAARAQFTTEGNKALHRLSQDRTRPVGKPVLPSRVTLWSGCSSRPSAAQTATRQTTTTSVVTTTAAANTTTTRSQTGITTSRSPASRRSTTLPFEWGYSTSSHRLRTTSHCYPFFRYGGYSYYGHCYTFPGTVTITSGPFRSTLIFQPQILCFPYTGRLIYQFR